MEWNRLPTNVSIGNIQNPFKQIKMILKNSDKILYMFIPIISMFISCRNVNDKVPEGVDWPRYQYDNLNSGSSPEQLEFPLFNSWLYISQHAPSPAWPPPAKQDYWHEIPKLSPLITFDRAYHITTMKNLLYFASSADNKIYCINAETGKESWAFFTEAPNRLAPVVYKERVYFGSDDGIFYCLNALNGEPVWKYKATGSSRKIIGNGRIISVSPVRTGCIVRNDTVFFAAGLFPRQEVYTIALDANNGTEIWKKKQDGIAPQGYPVASDREIIIPNSRSRPYAFDLKTGEQSKRLTTGAGGDYIALSDTEIFHGMNNFGEITGDDILKAAFSGHRIITTGDTYYIASDYRLTAINKADYEKILRKREYLKKELENITNELRDLFSKSKKLKASESHSINRQIEIKLDSASVLGERIQQLEGKEILWSQSIVRPYSMILTKNALIVGEEDRLGAYSAVDGKLIWNHQVEGCVYGLSVSHNKLFASTDKGFIYCFCPGEEQQTEIVRAGENSRPFKRDKFYAETARQILDQANLKKGFCLVLDFNEGNLAYEIAMQSEMNIIGVETDGWKVKELREKFDRAGLYGNRVTIFEGNLKELAFTDYFANLVVSDKLLTSGRLTESIEEIYRLLRPGGGLACLGQPEGKERIIKKKMEEWVAGSIAENCVIDEENGIWLKIQREKLPGSGEWTHLYANPQNTASSDDKLVNDHLVPQWFGAPGPREMADRHHRAMTPLFKNGIVYIPGFARLFAADAYNGTLLWEKVIPDFNRLGIFRDAGNMVITDEMLYMALTSEAIALNPETGHQEKMFVMPQLFPRRTRYWGYLAVQDNKLLGSGRKPEAGFNSMSWQDDNELWYDYQRSVTSDYIFCLDRLSGKNLWTYCSGIIVNPTITVGGNRMYFLESHHPVALADEDGLLRMEDVLGDQAYLVALDLQSGELLWKKHLDISVRRHSIFLSYKQEKLITVSGKNKNNGVYYDVYAFNAENGDLIWHQEQDNEKAIGGGHGEQHLHQAIVGDRVYAEPYAYELQTGNLVKDWKLVRNGHGCGTISASENNLFFRAGNPALCNLYEDETAQKINIVNRPGCWINIIPAGGLVLIPEASSGCSCDFPLQTSLVYLPRSGELDAEISQ